MLYWLSSYCIMTIMIIVYKMVVLLMAYCTCTALLFLVFVCTLIVQGGPIKTAHFQIPYFRSQYSIIMQFLQFLFVFFVKYSLQTSQNIVPCKCQC